MSYLEIATANEWGSFGFVVKVKNGIPCPGKNP